MGAISTDERLNILYGDVLSVYGMPQDSELLQVYGSKIFDKRTILHKIATEVRRKQLIKEYGLEGWARK